MLEARRNGELFGLKRRESVLKRKSLSVERLPHVVLDRVLAVLIAGKMEAKPGALTDTEPASQDPKPPGSNCRQSEKMDQRSGRLTSVPAGGPTCRPDGCEEKDNAMDTLTLERTLEERVDALEAAFKATRSAVVQAKPLSPPELRDKVCLVVFSGDLDKLLAAFSIATGAAAMGTEVCMFFTFWATPFLKREGQAHAAAGKRSGVEKVFARMLPPGEKGLRLSRMHLGGLGKAMIEKRMREKNIADCGELLQMAQESGVQIKVCEMSMDLMGIRMEELIEYPGLEPCGVSTFMDRALDSCTTLFI